MTHIRTRCPSCGEVELDADQIALHLPAESPDAAFYDFVCPTCTSVVRKPADEQVAQLLIGGGVEVVVDDAHPERPVGGPPLTVDDLLDLLLELRTDDWFARLCDTVASEVRAHPTP